MHLKYVQWYYKVFIVFMKKIYYILFILSLPLCDKSIDFIEVFC